MAKMQEQGWLFDKNTLFDIEHHATSPTIMQAAR